MKPFQIKELKINEENDGTGVELISFVDSPATEIEFEAFGKYTIPQVLPFYKFTCAPEPEIIETSHPFCRRNAGKVYHESEINKWGAMKDYAKGWIVESNFFRDFNGNTSTSFSGSEQIYNCRHTLRRVTSMNEVPRDKWRYLNLEEEKNEQIYLTLSDVEKREVSGVVLVSGKMIYRNNCDGLGNPGYIYFSRNTVRLAKQKYGFNRTISVHHKTDLTGSAILLDSWLVEDEELNQTFWHCKYKIIGNDLWNMVKAKQVLGFSLEALFAF